MHNKKEDYFTDNLLIIKISEKYKKQEMITNQMRRKNG